MTACERPFSRMSDQACTAETTNIVSNNDFGVGLLGTRLVIWRLRPVHGTGTDVRASTSLTPQCSPSVNSLDVKSAYRTSGGSWARSIWTHSHLYGSPVLRPCGTAPLLNAGRLIVTDPAPPTGRIRIDRFKADVILKCRQLWHSMSDWVLHPLDSRFTRSKRTPRALFLLRVKPATAPRGSRKNRTVPT
jgi:hypothetical protein